MAGERKDNLNHGAEKSKDTEVKGAAPVKKEKNSIDHAAHLNNDLSIKAKKFENASLIQAEPMKELGGSIEEINKRTAEIDEQIRDVKEGAIESIEHVSDAHELSDFLSNPEIDEVDLDVLHQQTQRFRKSQRAFNKHFNDHILTTDNKKERGVLLNKMLESKQFHPKTAGQCATVFNTFKEAGDFEKMITIYNQSESVIFKKSAIIRESLAIALHKVGDSEKSEEVALELIKEGKGSGDVYTILGKIHKAKHDQSRSEDPEKAAASLRESVNHLDTGFRQGFEFNPGINLVYNLITEGGHENNVDKIQKALKTAELVHLSAQKAGGINSGDFRTVSTVLETSLMTGKEHEKALKKVVERAHVDWKLSESINHLEILKEQIGHLDDPKSKEMVKNIENALIKLNERLKELQDGTKPNTENVEGNVESENKREEATNYIFKNGFSYGETSSFVGGNLEYGGQLHAHVVNRWDITVGREFLKKAGLDNVSNFQEFNKTIDGLIRQRYETAPLEDLQSPEHGEFDDFMKKLNGELNVEKQDDSRTNVMVDFFLGKGDCRQHAHTKQLFFDIWKTDQINEILKKSYEALDKNDEKTFQEGIEKAKSLVNLQMFVFDSVITAPVQIEEKYKTKTDTEGRKLLTADGSSEQIEDHTWNGLVELDEDGLVTTFTKTDSFYQNEYNFSEGAETNMDEIATKGFSGGDIDVFDPLTNQTVKIPVRLTPTPYAGNREARMKPHRDDMGLPLLRGLAIDSFASTEGKPDVSNLFSEQTNSRLSNFRKKIRNGRPKTKNVLLDPLNI